MTESVPICFLRIWCRKNSSWLSFKTASKDLFVINPSGYFIELPGGSLSQLSPRMTFPVLDHLVCLPLRQLTMLKQYGHTAPFIAVPMVMMGEELGPLKVEIESLCEDPLANLEGNDLLEPSERYVLLKAIEAGLVPLDNYDEILHLRNRFKTIGSALVYSGTCLWEALLAYCLDTRPLSRFDSAALRSMLESREWELIGEILIALGKITRTQLEYVIKMKRDGNQPLGDLLVSLNACKEEELEHCLKIQTELKQTNNGNIALIGKLLVEEGIVLAEDLEETLTLQKAQLEQGGTQQLLGEMLIAKQLCTVEELEQMLGFQGQVRQLYNAGINSIDSILINAAKIPAAKVQEAIQIQSICKNRLGEILVTIGACSSESVEQGLQLQEKWRAKKNDSGDRLGEVLVHQGIIQEENLKASLIEQTQEEKPLGRILIERNLCTPEQIITVLIARDFERRRQFLEFLNGEKQE